jgi:hypothetical protein
MVKLKVKVGAVEFKKDGKKCHIEFRDGKKVLGKTNEICTNKKEKVKNAAWNEVLQLEVQETASLVVEMVGGYGSFELKGGAASFLKYVTFNFFNSVSCLG